MNSAREVEQSEWQIPLKVLSWVNKTETKDKGEHQYLWRDANYETCQLWRPQNNGMKTILDHR
jgi:hypothetical protein